MADTKQDSKQADEAQDSTEAAEKAQAKAEAKGPEAGRYKLNPTLRRITEFRAGGHVFKHGSSVKLEADELASKYKVAGGKQGYLTDITVDYFGRPEKAIVKA